VGKRESVKQVRHERDYYATVDPVAADILNSFFVFNYPTRFIEPCAGNGQLARDLCKYKRLYCAGMCDIEPQDEYIIQRNCLSLTKDDCSNVDYFITNPPFTWTSLQPILDTLPKLLPTWLLLPADMMHNVRMGPYMKKCSTVLSIGRMYWFEDKPIKGVDNFAWFCFEGGYCETRFVGR
jgi:hypothetical protein